MPRRPRLVLPGCPHHLLLRGNNRSAVFHDDQDRRFFITCLKDTKKKTKSKIYAYCLMTNHLHLLIEPSKEDGLSNMMQSLGRRYVQVSRNFNTLIFRCSGGNLTTERGECVYWEGARVFLPLNP